MFKGIVLTFLCFAASACCAAAEPYQREIRNVTMADASHWYAVDCADAGSGISRVRKVNIRCRQSAGMKVSFDPQGASYFTVPAGQTYFEDGLDMPVVFYLQPSRNGDQAEVVVYR